jgi:hypothetical protein
VGAARQLELRARLHLGRSDGDELDLALPVCEAVLILMRAVERRSEVVLQRDGQLERLSDITKIRLALSRQLARLTQRDDVRAHLIAPFVGGDETERRQDTGDLWHEHRSDAKLVRELTCVQRTGAAEGDEDEIRRIVSLLDGDHPKRAQHLSIDDLHHCGRVDAVQRALCRCAI